MSLQSASFVNDLAGQSEISWVGTRKGDEWKPDDRTKKAGCGRTWTVHRMSHVPGRLVAHSGFQCDEDVYNTCVHIDPFLLAKTDKAGLLA